MQDIDECLNDDACNMTGNCTNGIGSYSCECKPGYDSDTYCKLVDRHSNSKTKNSKLKNFKDNHLAIALLAIGPLMLLFLAIVAFYVIRLRRRNNHPAPS